MKPWHKKEWREMRDQRIGDRCEQCDSTDGPFVLQHFLHERPEPPSKSAIISEMMYEYHAYPKPTTQRLACPRCMKISIRSRRNKKPTWCCIKCTYEFDEPIKVNAPVSNKVGKDDYARWVKGRGKARNDFKTTHKDEIGQRYGAAMADYEKEKQASYDRYLSGEGTATFCKKCAFLWDMKGQRLCVKCRKNYHPFAYDHCYDCLPQSRKEELQKQREDEEELFAAMKAFEEAAEAAYSDGGGDEED